MKQPWQWLLAVLLILPGSAFAQDEHAGHALGGGFGEALAVFFQNYDTLGQQTRTARYVSAMERLHARYPADSEAAAFYALALLEAVDLMDKTYSKQLMVSHIFCWTPVELRTTEGKAEFTSLDKEGWLRP